MFGFTFGQTVFETEFGRVDPASEIHFGLLLLVIDSNDGIARDEVCELLWPESRIDQRRHNLRQALYRLRQLGIAVHLRDGSIAYVGPDDGIDLRRLQRGLVDRDELLRVGTLPFLPGYAPQIGPRFTAWVDALRDRADAVRRHALAEAVRDARRRVCFPEVEKLARALLALDPLNETATLALAESIAMDGSKVEALRLLEKYEEEVGATSDALRIPARTLRRRVSESLDEWLLPRKFEVPFVGRDEEFNELRERFLQARGGESGIVILSGEAGIGKTRAASELLRLAVLDGARVISYTCTSGDALTPLSSLLTLINALLSQRGALGCATEHLQYLRSIASPSADTPPLAHGMSAEVAYAQLVYSLSELVAAIVDEVPLVVFVDDAHRLHQMAWQVLTDVIDRLPQGRILLLIGTRQLPEWYSTLGASSSDRRPIHVRLKPFGGAASLRFLSAWSEKNGIRLEESQVSQFSATSGGNPFYLSEMAGHVGRGGDMSSMPASIRGLIEVQFAAVSRDAQRTICVVSLLQARASLTLVSRALELPTGEFSDALNELERTGLVTYRGNDIRLKHDMVAEACMDTTEGGVTSFLRARVADILEKEGRSSGNLDAMADCVHHWQLLGEHERTRLAAADLGDMLSDRGLASQAVTAFMTGAEAATDPMVRLSLFERALTSAYVAVDWVTIHSSRARRRALLKEANREPDQFSDMYVAELESAFWLENQPVHAQLLERARDTCVSASLRLRAAIVCAIAADNSLDLSGVERAHQSVADLLGADTEVDSAAATLRLIAATSLGTASQVRVAVNQHLAAGATRPIAQRLLSTRQAATALMRVGENSDAIRLLRGCREDALRLKMPMHIASSSEKLAMAQLFLLNFEDVPMLIDDIRANLPTSQPPHGVLAYEVLASYAWLSNLPQFAEIARSHLLNALTWSDLPATRRIAILGALLMTERTLSLDPSPGVVDGLYALLATPALWGLTDGYAVCLIQALVASDRVNDAREMYEAYAKGGFAARGVKPSLLWDALASHALQGDCDIQVRLSAISAVHS